MLFGVSPTRISFAGGGTDMPEYFEKYGGIVITTAINHFSYVFVNNRHDRKFQIFSPDFQAHNVPMSWDKLQPKKGTELPVAIIKHLKFKKGINLMLSSDVPPRSGLGSSSSLAVNLVNVISKMKGMKISSSEIAECAHKIERNYLKWPMGKQDEYISVFGGFRKILFSKGKITVSDVKISQKTLVELEGNLLLFFIGSRTNTKILPTQIKKIEKKDENMLKSLNRVKELANTMLDQIRQSDITAFGELLHKGWITKKEFSKSVTNERIDRIYQNAIKHGAIGGKLTGAGGGGHLLLYCEKSKQAKVIQKMEKLELRHIKFNFHKEGAKILNLYDYTGTKK